MTIVRVNLSSSYRIDDIINITNYGCGIITKKGKSLYYLPGGKGVSEFEVEIFTKDILTNGEIDKLRSLLSG